MRQAIAIMAPLAMLLLMPQEPMRPLFLTLVQAMQRLTRVIRAMHPPTPIPDHTPITLAMAPPTILE
jgi:uncharacterized protein YggT (Ycf19 family)